MTRVTSTPASRNEISAAGPAAWMTTPLPTNRPAPMVPPIAIMVMCRCFSPLRSPVSSMLSFSKLPLACRKQPLSTLEHKDKFAQHSPQWNRRLGPIDEGLLCQQPHRDFSGRSSGP